MSSQDRAAARRREWTAKVVEAGEPKVALYADLTYAERLLALAELNRRVWGESVRTNRAEWPAEVFELHPTS